MQRLAPLDATVGPPYVVALCIALAAAAGTTIQPRLPSRFHGLCVQNHDARRVRRLVPGVIYPARPMRRFRPEGDPPPVA